MRTALAMGADRGILESSMTSTLEPLGVAKLLQGSDRGRTARDLVISGQAGH